MDSGTHWLNRGSTGGDETDNQSGEGNDNDGLPRYEENDTTGTDGGANDQTGDNTASECQNNNGIPTTNGTLDFVANPGISGLDSSLAQGYVLFSAFLNGANLATTGQQAQTGDSSPFFDAVYDLIFPVIPDNSTLDVAFQDFSDFVDQTRGVPEC